MCENQLQRSAKKLDRCTGCSPVTALCRFKCGVLEVCALPSVVGESCVTQAALVGGQLMWKSLAGHFQQLLPVSCHVSVAG